jgi:hypothetical protein
MFKKIIERAMSMKAPVVKNNATTKKAKNAKAAAKKASTGKTKAKAAPKRATKKK